MRIEGAVLFGIDWTVYHCERCEVLSRVIWIDTGTLEWAEMGCSLIFCVCVDEFKAKKMRVIADGKMILINPLDDVADAEKDEHTVTGGRVKA